MRGDGAVGRTGRGRPCGAELGWVVVAARRQPLSLAAARWGEAASYAPPPGPGGFGFAGRRWAFPGAASSRGGWRAAATDHPLEAEAGPAA